MYRLIVVIILFFSGCQMYEVSSTSESRIDTREPTVDSHSIKTGDDEVAIEQNNTIIIDVLKNDISDSSNSLKVESISQEPMHGVALIEDNKIKYTSNSNFIGDDRIKYITTDAYGNQEEGNILVHIIDKRVKPLFNSYIEKLKKEVHRKLKNEDMYILYDMQTYMQSSVIYADRYHDKEMLQKLLELVSIPFEPEYIGDDELWLDYVTLENYADHDPYLASTQFFSLLTRVLSACERNGISTENFRTPKVVDGHTYDNLKIIEDHLEKWSRVLPSKFSVSKDLSMKLRFNNTDDRIFIKTMTTKGFRYLYYNLENSSRGHYIDRAIHIGLGSDVVLNEWYDFERDLEADLKKYESDNEFLYAYQIQIQTKYSVDIRDLSVDGSIFGRSKIIPYAFPVNEGFRKIWRLLDSSKGESTLEEDSSFVKIKAYSNDALLQFAMDFTNGYQLWDAPKELSDVDMFIYQSLLQYDDYTKSIGRAFNPAYKEKMIKGLYKNIIDNFTYNSDDNTYSFSTYQRRETHASYGYSGYGIETTKDMMFNSDGTVKLAPKSTVTGWDLSHGRRLNWLIETSIKFGSEYNVVIPEEIINGYIKNLSLSVCIGDESDPHFTIYQNGRRGWYRVGYSDRLFFGYSPADYAMDVHFASGSYAMFSSEDAKLKKWIDTWVEKHSEDMLDFRLLDYLTSKSIEIF